MYKFSCKLIGILLIIVLSSIATACSRENNLSDVPAQTNEDALEIMDAAEAETEVKTVEDELEEWIENSKDIFLAQSRELAGKQYFLVTYGRKKSSGYSVEITEIEKLEDHVEVHVSFRQPQETENAETLITYPYALESIDATGLPVKFVVHGAEEYVPQLLEIDYLQPIVAQADGIKIFSPPPGTQVGRRFTVEGIANVVEGNFQYKLTDSFGKTLVAGYSTAAMGDWKYFVLELKIEENLPVGSPLQLVLFTQNAKDGSISEQIILELPFAEI